MLPDMLDAYLPTGATKATLLDILRSRLLLCEVMGNSAMERQTRDILTWLEGVPVRPGS